MRTMPKGVLLDTSIWVRYSRLQRHKGLKAEVEKALAADLSYIEGGAAGESEG